MEKCQRKKDEAGNEGGEKRIGIGISLLQDITMQEIGSGIREDSESDIKEGRSHAMNDERDDLRTLPKSRANTFIEEVPKRKHELLHLFRSSRLAIVDISHLGCDRRHESRKQQLES